MGSGVLGSQSQESSRDCVLHDGLVRKTRLGGRVGRFFQRDSKDKRSI